MNNVIQLLLLNFFVCYIWHIALTFIFFVATTYITKSSKFKNQKLLNMQQKINLSTYLTFYSGCHTQPISFDLLIPFINPIIIFESMNPNEFVAYHEFAHIKKKHTLKYFLLTTFIGCYLALVFDKIVWWENVLIDFVSFQLLGRYFEHDADIYAIKLCSDEELLKAISLLTDIKKEKFVQSYFDKFINIIDVHPTEKQRIASIRKELLVRKCNPNYFDNV